MMAWEIGRRDNATAPTPMREFMTATGVQLWMLMAQIHELKLIIQFMAVANIRICNRSLGVAK
ncbi:hypothetical protein BJY04DRAFT_199197 [Aspergillus karnatakaensis]|uniref:uncharacterized protein n=1 Tax=Aspergillus karnatakaensis TaxID=1810916 RepID=UPI003CCD52FF